MIGALAALLVAVALAVALLGLPDKEPATMNGETADGPEPTGAPAGARATVAVVGDILLMHVDDPFEHVSDVLREADITFGNLESPLSTNGEPSPLKFENGRLIHNEFIFGADPGSVRRLSAAGFDVLSLANNHAMDYGATALRETFDLLEEHGIVQAGAGGNLDEARSAAIVERNGLRVAFLAYVSSTTLPGTEHFEASGSAPGLAFMHSTDGRTPTEASLRMLREDIAAARQQAHVVAVSFHWGREVHSRPSALQVQLAHRAVDAGADLVLGHHPHVLQAVEVYEGNPILYSLGNFVFKSRRPELRMSAIGLLTLGPAGVERIVFRGAWIPNVRPFPSGGSRARRTAERIVALSRERGTQGLVAPSDGVPVAVFDLTREESERQEAPPAVSEGDLVDVASVVPGIVVDLPYATEDNVFGQRLYRVNRAFLRGSAALKLREAQDILEQSGVRLKVWDAYRPLSVQKKMWEQVRDARYVAPPSGGSNHNRGAAVDVTLVDREGRELPMGTGYDDFSGKAHAGYDGLSEEERRNRAILRHAMVSAGFRPLSTEWWHFDDPDARRHPVGDVPIRSLAAAR